jgi:hypothetical protein
LGDCHGTLKQSQRLRAIGHAKPFKYVENLTSLRKCGTLMSRAVKAALRDNVLESVVKPKGKWPRVPFSTCLSGFQSGGPDMLLWHVA